MIPPHKRLLLILFVLFIFTTGCKYSPNGENFVDIKHPGNAPIVNVDLNFASDTLFLDRASKVIFSISAKNKVHWVKMMINNQDKGEAFSATGTFEISSNSGFWEIGTHALQLKFFTSTGTGSLADKLNTEGFLYSKIWILVIYDQQESTKYTGSNITNITDQNGKIQLKWTPYKGIDFKAYIIRKSHWINQTFDTVAVITDPTVTSAYDPSFIGEKSQYQIFTATSDPLIWYIGNTYNYQGQLPRIYSEYKGNGIYRIFWNKSNYDGNVNRYNLYKEKTYFYDLELLKSSVSPDTSFFYQTNIFGLDEKLILNLEPNIRPNYYQDYLWFYDFCVRLGYLGDPLHEMWLNLPDQFGGKFYYTAKDPKYKHKLYTYDTNTDRNDSIEVEPEIHQLAVSPTSKFIVGQSLNSGKFFVINSDNPNKIKYLSFGQIPGYIYSDVSFAVSDAGILAMDDNQKVTLFDLVNNKLILTEEHPMFKSSVKISADGTYLLRGWSLYHIVDNKLQFVKTFEDFVDGFSYPENRVIIKKMNKIEFIDCTGLSMVKFLDISGWYNNIDYRNNHVISYDKDNIYIYNLTSGNLIRQFKNGDYYAMSIFLVNGHLFSNHGVTIDISQDLK